MSFLMDFINQKREKNLLNTHTHTHTQKKIFRGQMPRQNVFDLHHHQCRPYHLSSDTWIKKTIWNILLDLFFQNIMEIDTTREQGH